MPEVNWQKEWFLNAQTYPRYFWKEKVNQRKFLDDVAFILGIKQPEEWGKVKYKEIIEYGGSGLLSNYNRSLFNTLQNVYTGRS